MLPKGLDRRVELLLGHPFLLLLGLRIGLSLHSGLPAARPVGPFLALGAVLLSLLQPHSFTVLVLPPLILIFYLALESH